MRLLLIEDDQKAARLLAKGLCEEQFIVDVAHTGEEGDELASINDYTVIILDVMLPGIDGIAVCRDLRSRKIFTPVLMLTARDGLGDRLEAFSAGADDYLTKPYAFAELLARIHALMHRSNLNPSDLRDVEQPAHDGDTERAT